jgi:indole-3-glycerol phosphate synthase
VSEILKKILATKEREVAADSGRVPIQELRARIRDLPPPRDFLGAIRERHRQGKPAVIAEIKRASPSQGQFRADFDAAAFAQSYAQHGAACLSVLTDRDYFQGSIDDLVAARAACSLPVLRKDFMIDAYQVFEARAMQADCILIISGAVPLATMQLLEDQAADLGMAVLVESHSQSELDIALKLKTPLVGINNRDLTTFKTDLATTERLRPSISSDRIAVTESGIATQADRLRMQALGVNTYLVGGAFMASPDPGAKLAALFS